MSAFSQWFEQTICNWVRGTAIATTPTALQIRLHTSDPLDDYSGAAEVGAGLGYTAQVITFAAPGSIVGTGTSMSNATTIIFGPATANWGSVTHWSVHGTAGDANFYFYGPFLAAKTVNTGDSYAIPAGALEILVR